MAQTGVLRSNGAKLSGVFMCMLVASSAARASNDRPSQTENVGAVAQRLANKFIRDITGPTHSPLVGCGLTAAAEGSEFSPKLAVNPKHRGNMIAYYIQSDQASDVVATTHDGGKHWANVVVPGLTRCSGGSAIAAFDPDVSFGGDGIAYLSTPVVDIKVCNGAAPTCGS